MSAVITLNIFLILFVSFTKSLERKPEFKDLPDYEYNRLPSAPLWYLFIYIFIYLFVLRFYN